MPYSGPKQKGLENVWVVPLLASYLCSILILASSNQKIQKVCLQGPCSAKLVIWVQLLIPPVHVGSEFWPIGNFLSFHHIRTFTKKMGPTPAAAS